MLGKVRFAEKAAAFALGLAMWPTQALPAVAAPTSSLVNSSANAGTITEFPIPDSNNMANAAPDIAAGPDGNLWFTGSKIGRITTAGATGEFPIPTTNGSPQSIPGITAGPDGNLWFTDSNNNKIGRITTSGAITEWATPTANSTPTGIAAGPDGNLWFTEQHPGQIGRITTAGSITEFPAPGTLVDITAGPDGNLWFTGSENEVGRITTAGVVTEFSPPNPNCINAITAGPDGNLWFAGCAGYIGQITPAGVITEYPLPSGGYPSDITAGPDGNLWFTDSDRIGRITTAGAITDYSGLGSSSPQGITSGPDGNLWFAEGINRIGKITVSGQISQFPIPGVPSGIAAGPDGNLWFSQAAEMGRLTTAGVITEFPTPNNGTFGAGGPGVALGIGPDGAVSGPDGKVWFTEEGANSIGRITTAGAVVSFPLPTGASPQDIAAGPDGNLWFTERANIGRITTAGAVTEFPIPTANSWTAGIAVGPDGNLWFTDEGAHQIGRITTAGAVTEFPISTPNNEPVDIAAGPDGNLWFTEPFTGLLGQPTTSQIGRITTAGAVTVFPIPTANSSPSGITAGPDGNLWFTDQGANQIGQITTAGVITEFPIPTPFSEPVDIAAGPDGNLWFSEQSANQIGRITTGATNTTTAMTSAPNPSVFGQPVTLMATVSGVGAATTPTGSVSFTDGGTTIGTGNLDASGQATVVVSSLSVGAHSLAATYSGDRVFPGSTSALLTQTVGQASTVTTITSDANPSSTGQTIRLTAAVAAVAPGSGTPAGSVRLKDGSSTLATLTLDAGGSATFATSSLSLGSHAVTAVYAGDPNFLTSTSAPFMQTVNQAEPTFTSLSSSSNPSAFSQSVTFTASVTSAVPGATPVPTGSVSFTDGTATLGTVNLDATAVANLTVTTLTVGSHAITATYSGGAGFNSSKSTVLTQVVNATAPSVTALTVDLNPAVFGQLVTLSATVTSSIPGFGTPTGTVTFKDGGSTLSRGTLNAAGQTTFTTSALTLGNHTITAVFGGDSRFSSSTSAALTQMITPAGILDFTSVAQSVQAGSASGTITVQLEDAAGHPMTAGAGGLLISLTTDSAFGTFRDLADTSTITTATIPAGATSVSFRYRDTFAATPTLTASADPSTGVARATQMEEVTGGPLDHLRLSPPQATVGLGNGAAYVSEGFDAFNNDLGNVTSSTTFSITPDGSCAAAFCVVSTIGSHTVTGTSGTATGTAQLVGDQAPIPSLVVQDGSGVAPHDVTFQISAIYSGANPLSYTLDFGDGNRTQGSLPSAPITYSYAAACHRCVVILSVSDGIATPPSNVTGTVDIAAAAPLVAMPGDPQTVVLGMAVHLDGSNSTPAPPGITKYHWDFGDSTSADGAVQDHAFSSAQDWPVTLTVSNAAGASNSATVVIHVVRPPSSPGLTISVTSGGQAVTGATVVVEDGRNNVFPAVDKGSGTYDIATLADGPYAIYGYAPGFIPGTTSATVVGGRGAASLTLSSGALAITDLTTQRLSAAQAIALGIDPNAPGNENVYQFELHLAFFPGTPCPGNCFFRGVASGGGFLNLGCSNCAGLTPDGSGGFSICDLIECITVRPGPPNEQPTLIWMIIPGKAKWLKEFFSVSLAITNLAPPPFVFRNGTATLNLPTGLSLAELNPNLSPQTLSHAMADIPGQGTVSTQWLIRGDQEGFYALSADYSAALQPVGAPVRLHAETNAANRIHIWGGSALRMTVDADDQAYANVPTSYPYHVRVSLTNVADVPVYNPLIELKPLPDGDPRRNYLFQPREDYDQFTDRIDPGATFTTRDYIVAPNFTGTLNLALSFVLTTGGNTFIPSTITSHPATIPRNVPTLEAVKEGGGVKLQWQPIPGAVAYQVFTTSDFQHSFSDSFLTQVDGSVSSVPLRTASYGEIALSTLIRGSDGTLHNVLYHNLTATSGVSPAAGQPDTSCVSVPSVPNHFGRPEYYRGPVQHHPRVYLIFWGSWWSQAGNADGRSTMRALTNLFKSLPGSGYNRILSAYFDDCAFISDDVKLAGTDVVNLSAPSDFSDATIQNLLTSELAREGWSNDLDTQFMIVSEPSFAWGGCPLHSHMKMGANPIVWVKINLDQNCTQNLTLSHADVATYSASHEYAEAATDPINENPFGWVIPVDSSDFSSTLVFPPKDVCPAGQPCEVGDMCEGIYNPALLFGSYGVFIVQKIFDLSSQSCASGLAPLTTTVNNITAAAGRNSATVSWSVPGTTSAGSSGVSIPVSGYLVTALINGTAAANSVTTTDLSVTLTGLAAGSYSFQVWPITGSSLGPPLTSNSVQVTGTASTYASTVIAAGPSAYYRLDDGAYLAADSSGHGRMAYYSNATSPSSPGALLNDPDTATISSLGHPVLLAPLQGLPTDAAPRSIEMWVQVHGRASAQTLFSYGTAASSQINPLFEASIVDGGTLAINLGTGAPLPFKLPSGHSIGDGVWHQVVVTYVKCAITVYVDGASLGSQTACLNTVTGNDLLQLSATGSLSVDEFAVYSKALPPPQVAAQYHAAGY